MLKVDGSGDTITMNKDSPVCVVGSWDGFSHSRSSECLVSRLADMTHVITKAALAVIHNEQSNAFGEARGSSSG